MPTVHVCVCTAGTSELRGLTRSLKDLAACSTSDPLPFGVFIPRDAKVWMDVKAMPADFARDDLNPKCMEQGLVNTLLVTALVEPGEACSNSLLNLLHGQLEVWEIPQTPLKVRDDCCYWLYINTSDVGSEASGFQQHYPATHEWVEDRQLLAGCLPVIGPPERRIGRGDT